MIKHNNILVPTDFSEQSTESLRRAAILANSFDADLHLLHVMEVAAYFETDMVSAPSLSDLDDGHQDRLLDQLKAQAKSCGVEAALHLEESTGGIARTICRIAKSLPADLIVIGKHGDKGVLEHMLLGATVERVVAQAPCSVLVTMPHGLLEQKKIGS